MRSTDDRILYAVGVVLYRLLSGQLPFDADTAVAIIQKQVSEPPTPISNFRPDLPVWCTTIIERALQKAPSARFQSAEQFRAALQAAVQPQTLGELPTLLTPTPPGLSVPWDTRATLEATHEHAVSTSTASRSGTAAAVATPPSQVMTALTPLEVARPTAATAAPAPAPQKHTTTTLVLGRTHLFAMAALVVVIMAGMAALGFAVFKRGSLQEQVPFLGTLPQASSTDASSTAPQDPAAQGTPAATPPAPAPPTPGAAGAVAATAGAGTAKPTASSVPPPSPPKPAVVPAALPPSGSTDPAAAKAGRGAGPAVPPATAAAAPPILFNDVRVLVTEAGKGRERQAVLQLADGRVSLVDRNGGGSIASLQYSEVLGAFFSRSKQPKWRDANGQEVESKADLGRLGFFRGDRNWLILLTAGEPLIIRLEDSNLQKVLPALAGADGRGSKEMIPRAKCEVLRATCSTSRAYVHHVRRAPLVSDRKTVLPRIRSPHQDSGAMIDQDPLKPAERADARDQAVAARVESESRLG